MHAHKIKVTIKADHQLSFKLPDDFPAGPAEIIILAHPSTEQHEQQIVKLAGILSPDIPPPDDIDPILDSLQALRKDREKRFCVQTDNK